MTVFQLTQNEMNTSDILSVLAWLAGPGLAIVSAFILDQLQPMQELSPTGKVVVSITVAGVLGVLAVALQQAIGGDSALIAKWQPYANILIPLVSLLAQQLAHGAQLGRERRMERKESEAQAQAARARNK